MVLGVWYYYAAKKQGATVMLLKYDTMLDGH